MFRNILVGVDRQVGGRDALALAQQLMTDDGRLTLGHVYPGDPRIWRTATDEYEALQQEGALSLLTQVRDDADVSAELRSVECSSPGRGLHELAEAMGADLLVVGSSHRGMLGRVFLGDDTHDALNGAPCAVAVAPAGHAQNPLPVREIGVAYNESAESEYAVSVARALAEEFHASLSACEVITLPAYTFLGGAAPVDGAVEDLVAKARERISALGAVKPRAVYGPAVDELALYSASVDLLIVGSRGYGPMGRLVHGSTSSQLAHAARCPLLVLTRGARVVEDSNRAEIGGEVAAAN